MKDLLDNRSFHIYDLNIFEEAATEGLLGNRSFHI
jgi:hypothetical protein